MNHIFKKSLSGIVAGSVAAGLQSTIGNVAAGSVFATLQSVGATGVTLGTKAVIGGVGAGVCGTFKIISSYFW